ncbi:hypothetical protein GQ44DRAFT_704761 [Phaeosphaeriaceae sp. PMI808]|nr:hypothetical protein GQ44DRAFT_704761 [Phaeosphaeriaceae sp. PMI808]
MASSSLPVSFCKPTRLRRRSVAHETTIFVQLATLRVAMSLLPSSESHEGHCCATEMSITTSLRRILPRDESAIHPVYFDGSPVDVVCKVSPHLFLLRIAPWWGFSAVLQYRSVVPSALLLDTKAMRASIYDVSANHGRRGYVSTETILGAIRFITKTSEGVFMMKAMDTGSVEDGCFGQSARYQLLNLGLVALEIRVGIN